MNKKRLNNLLVRTKGSSRINGDIGEKIAYEVLVRGLHFNIYHPPSFTECVYVIPQPRCNLIEQQIEEKMSYEKEFWGECMHLRRFMGGKWRAPKYALTFKIPFIPTEREIDQLISGSGKKLATLLQLLKETAMRSGEANGLRWADVDIERKVIRVTPEKGSNPRIFKVSSQLIAMLNGLPRINERVFGRSSYNSLRGSFMAKRKQLAHKLKNPRLIQIHFHTLRHWKATMLYHQTKDILYVKKFLGHKNIECTLIYIQLEETLFQQSDQFTVRVAETVDEAVKLVETGFEFVTDMADGDGKSAVKIFRKRK